MKLKTLIQSQRDSRWGSEILGNNSPTAKDAFGNPYNLYWYACLITSLGNYVGKTPAEVNQLLKDNGGYEAGSGNFIWAKSTILGLTQQYLSPRCQSVAMYATEVAKLREFLKNGYPALVEVDFNPSTDPEEMHFVLAVGYTDSEIIVVDPWEGQIETWADSAFQRNAIQFRVYNLKLQEDTGAETAPTSPSSATVAVDATLYPKLITKCNNRDQVYDELGVSREPIEDNIIKPKAVLDGLRNLATGLQRQLAEALTEVKNRIEQVARIQQTADASATTQAARIEALEKAQKAFDIERESLKGQITDFAKAKGQLAIELETTKTKLAQEQSKSCTSMTAGQLFSLWIAKVISIKRS